ncbi:PulJ/GspJ family protein [Tautonia rosea]|uniref:PulJ/GspJ family protein n=1 Tax=Tautonia rosea TaxID=2728037 RepID=UPI0014734388|nr:prepilin-type N-terminal cleavage/methylation domain-containing protein [Tautonia rosea]
MTRTTRRRFQRHGFTLIEMAIATALTGMLGVLCLLSWKAFGVPAVDSYYRSRLAGEAIMAAASLSADLGGSLPPFSGPTGDREDHRLVGWRSEHGNLELWYDSGQDPVDPDPEEAPSIFSEPNHAIVYSFQYPLDSSRGVLVRSDSRSGTSSVVATDLASMEIDIPYGSEERMILTLEFEYRIFKQTHSRFYTFEAILP